MTILVKYCDNAYKYYANTWKMCSPPSVILASIDTILVSFEANLKYFKASGWTITLKLTSKVDNHINSVQISSKSEEYCAHTWAKGGVGVGIYPG